MAERKRAGEGVAIVVAPTPKPIVTEPDNTRILSGSVLADLVLGGGWGRGTIINIVGDRSSGKTLLAVEAIVNFVASGNPVQNVKYVDAESIFDSTYAAVLGLPSGIQTTEDENGVGGMETIQEFFKDIDLFLKNVSGPSLYILDSLDSLSDTDEMERDYDKGSYGAEKAKKLSQFFRRMVTRLARADCTLIIVSQLRDKIGVTFGETKTRSGGKALDFYCSQIVWLAETGKIKRTAHNIERAVGIETRFRTKKNKIGKPFREADLTIIFDYGIDDEVSMLNWLVECKVLDAKQRDAEKARIASLRVARDRDAVENFRDEIADIVREQWGKIEDRLAPPMGKYQR